MTEEIDEELYGEPLLLFLVDGVWHK